MKLFALLASSPFLISAQVMSKGLLCAKALGCFDKCLWAQLQRGAIMGIFFFFFLCALSATAQQQQYFTPATGGDDSGVDFCDGCNSSSEIGPGITTISDIQVGEECNEPFTRVENWKMFLGTITLLPSLQILKSNGQWIPQSVTYTGPGLVQGQSTFVSTVSAGGLVTTYEWGSYNVLEVPSWYDSGTVTSTETLDLNTGKYALHVVVNDDESGAPGCGQTEVETQDRTAVLPVLPLVQASPPSGGILTIVNPATLPPADSTDPSLVANSPPAWGIAADGVSGALLVFQSTSSVPVKFTLSTPDYTIPDLTISAYARNYLAAPQKGSAKTLLVNKPIISCAGPNQTCTFFALVWAPSQMPYSIQPVGIQVAATQAASDSSPASDASTLLLLEPPPLVLVHGIWSSAGEAWLGPSGFKTWLGQNHYPQSIVMAADYEKYHSLDFRNPNTQQILALTIANALSTAFESGVVASKVDVFAHSMGGLVTRWFMDHGSPPPFIPSDLPLNPIHQLITVGAPQIGTPFATFLEKNKNDTIDLPIPNPIVSVLCAATQKCTLGTLLAFRGKKIGSAVESLEGGLQPVVEPYRGIIGEDTSLSSTEKELNVVLAAFTPGKTVNNILGTPSDTIVPAANQGVNAIDTATINGIVHTAIIEVSGFNDTIETHSSAVWSQATDWLLNKGQAPSSQSGSIEKSNTAHQSTIPEDSGSIASAPILDLTGYAQVAASNVTFSPDSSMPLMIGVNSNITATSSSKTISEILLFQTVSDPADTPLYAVTQSPFSVAFTPARLGSANFIAFAVFTDNTFATLPLNYGLQPSGSALSLSIQAPAASLPIGLTTIVPAQAEFTNGPVDVTNVATYAARSGGTTVLSVGTDGSITSTGNGLDWLDVNYGGQTASAMISVGSCTYSLGPTNQIVQQPGGSADIQVTTLAGCSWTADSGGASWVSLSGASGAGNGTVSVSVRHNDTGITRTAFIAVAGENVAIIQPASVCSTTLGTTHVVSPASGASGSIAVTTSCPVIANSSAPWVSATPLSSSVEYFITANTSASVRTAEITIGVRTVQITQAGALLTPSVTLTPSSSSITTAQSLTVTVAVSGGSGNPTPNGSVTLTSGKYRSAAMALDGGDAKINIPAGSLSAGTNSLTAGYLGDGSYFAETSSPVVVLVTGTSTPTIKLAETANSIDYGGSVILTATLSGSGSTPTGTVAFRAGTTQLGTRTLNSGGVATYSTNTLATGSHSFTAIYSGDSKYRSAISKPLSLTVNKAMPTVKLASSALSATFGEKVILTATMTGKEAKPAGTMNFLDGSTKITTETVNSSGVGTCATSKLAVGKHTITADYTGNNDYLARTSNPVTVTISAQ